MTCGFIVLFSFKWTIYALIMHGSSCFRFLLDTVFFVTSVHLWSFGQSSAFVKSQLFVKCLERCKLHMLIRLECWHHCAADPRPRSDSCVHHLLVLLYWLLREITHLFGPCFWNFGSAFSSYSPAPGLGANSRLYYTVCQVQSASWIFRILHYRFPFV